MQIYANVTGKELQVVTTPYASALGSAIFAAAAADQSDGGYESVLLAASHMTHRMTFRYQPETDKVSLYNKLYPLYQQLHDSFWKELKVMKQLKDFKLKEGLGVEIK
ncbi:Ribulokinase [compost metagenome]